MARVPASIAIFLASLAVVTSRPVAGSRTLVILQSSSLKTSHSAFFAALEARGHDVTFELATGNKAALEEHEERLYDHLVLFAPHAEEFGSSKLSAKAISHFVDAGGNVLLAADAGLSELMRDVAAEFGVEFDEDSSARVIDHFNFDAKDTGEHSRIVADGFTAEEALLPKMEAPVLFEGAAFTAMEEDTLLQPILSGSPTAYNAKPASSLKTTPSAVGKAAVLVGAVQGQVLPKSGNEVFASEISKWVFQERSVLRWQNAKYVSKGKDGEGKIEEGGVLRIKDEVEYSLEIAEWNGESWVPFQGDDVQVSMVMLDPYQRRTMKHDGKGLFSVQFGVPHVWGVYSFIVDYRKQGYSYIHSVLQTSVRPYHNNEYERYIPAAFPYYMSAVAMMAGLFIFVGLFMYHEESPKVKQE